MYCLNLMRIALELAIHNHVYEDIATKFFEHFLSIAEAMTNIGGDGNGVGLWNEEDQFYYDELNLPDGRMETLEVRSLVGLIPMFAVEILEPELLDQVPEFKRRLTWFLNHRPGLAKLVSRWDEPGRGERRLLSLLRGHRMKQLLRRMLDETEFLSEYGIRSLSKAHLDQPYVSRTNSHENSVSYQPAVSNSSLFGGNSNWRGPIWFPVNYLLIESLQKFHHYYGDDFKVECPTGTGKYLTICEVANELCRRLTRIFVRDEDGRRAVFGGNRKTANRSALPRLCAFPRILSRRQWPRRRRFAPNGLDRPDREIVAAAQGRNAGGTLPSHRGPRTTSVDARLTRHARISFGSKFPSYACM